jgi:ceramide glucosyltransferase
VSDADVRAPSHLLRNLVALLEEPAATAADASTDQRPAGLVTCFYRIAESGALTPAMRWEAVAVNADFWSQVLQGLTFRELDFALGAVMALRRGDLSRIGGFRALADYLADDFQLGRRIACIGRRVVLCPVVVECWSPPARWGEVWRHQLRWARTIRVCQPGLYALSILGNATLWPLAWVLAAVALACGQGHGGTEVASGALGVRVRRHSNRMARRMVSRATRRAVGTVVGGRTSAAQRRIGLKPCSLCVFIPCKTESLTP